jgi:hypothetical protein
MNVVDGGRQVGAADEIINVADGGGVRIIVV